MLIKDKWIEQMTSAMKLATGASEKELKKFLGDAFDRDFRDSEAQIYNNYEEEIIDTTLAKCLDWIKIENPCIAESGVFFKNRLKARNLNGEILLKQLNLRDVHKKLKFKAKNDGDGILAAFHDITQLNYKKKANSGYGVENERSSFLYNVHSGMSVTASGRGQISTACQCYENLFSDYVKFKNMDEYFVFLNNIINEKDEWQFKLTDVIDKYPTKKEFVTRMINKFDPKFKKLCDVDAIKASYENLGDKLATRVFYKANMRAFLLNDVIASLFREVSLSNCVFLDPNVGNKENKIDDDVKAKLKVISELCIEFVNYKYQPFRYEDRSKYDERDVVIIMDTDSNIIYYGALYRYIMENIVPIRLARNKDEKKMFVNRVLNIIAYITTDAIRNTLDHYLDTVNVLPEDKHLVHMKNEFYFDTVIVTHAKKSYIALISRQEALVFKKPELEVKGVNFFKSTTTEKTSKFIYDEVLINQLLMPKNGKINLKEVISSIRKYEDDMVEQISSGDMGYFKKSVKVKSAEAYKTPLSISAYKSVYVWNKICNPQEVIELPSTVVQIKVKLFKKKDLALLADYPEMYEKFLNLFETNENIAKSGIKAIALPYGTEEVPEWLKKIIDTDTICADNMKLFAQLYKPLGLAPGHSSYNGTQMKFYSNIVRI